MSLLVPNIRSNLKASDVHTTVSFSATDRLSSNNGFAIRGVASSSDGSKLVAAIDGNQIYTSTDSGVNWTARDSSRAWYSVASSSDGSKLVAVVFNGQIYTSTDSGVNWTARNSSRAWYSVASSSDGSKLVAVVLGGQIYTSTDSGVNWTARDSSRNWYSVASSSDGSKLVATVLSGQIYTSTDSGVNWTARDSSRAWRDVASSNNGIRLFAGTALQGIYLSTDSGITWIKKDIGLTGEVTGLACDSTGTIVTCSVTSGSSEIGIYFSFNSGLTWFQNLGNYPSISAAFSSNGKRLLLFYIGGTPGPYTLATSALGGGDIINIGVNSTTLNTFPGDINTVGISASTLNSSSAVTCSNVSSLRVQGPPIIGSNITNTNRYAINVGTGTSIFRDKLIVLGSGDTSAATSQFLIDTSSTTLSGSNDYYWSHFATPSTSGSSTGTGATVTIGGPPSGLTNSYALRAILGNIMLTSGRYLSTSLGTASSPILSIGASLNDGIFSGGAGQINISTGGTSRVSFSSSSMTLSSDYAITGSGAATITSGTGGFTSAGPVSSSLTSSATACAIRPTNSANTGIFGTASTACNIAVGGTTVLSCSTSGSSVTGTFSASGVSTLSSGINTLLIRPISGNTSTVCPTTNSATGTSELLITPSSAGWSSGGTSRTLFGDSSHSIEAVNGTGMTIYDVNKILFTSVGPYNFIDNGSTTMLTYGSTLADPIVNNTYGLNFGSATAGSSLNIFSNVSHVVKIGRNNDGDAIRFYRNNPSLNVVGSITLSASGTTYNTTSDRRLKQDITEKKDSLAALKQIKIYDYKFKDDNEKQKYCGVLADEIRSIMPEVVSGKDDKLDEYGNIEPLMVDYSRIIPYLIGSIQELVDQIEDLKKKNK